MSRLPTEPATVDISVDGERVVARSGVPLLVALLEQRLHPTGGGCLCLAGDCSHCLATVDGESYVRTCQTPVREQQVVVRSHKDGDQPPLLSPDGGVDAARAQLVHRYCDSVVIGAGESGVGAARELRQRGSDVVVLDAARGDAVAGIYPEREVLVRTPRGMEVVHARDEVVVATGAAEIQPVGLGTHLEGLMTRRACEQMAEAGVELGQVAAVGTAPEGIERLAVAPGRFLRCEAGGRDNSRVQAVVTVTEDGEEVRTPCDTVSFGLGNHPRDALFRMARGLSARLVGDAARPTDIPPAPLAGTVCACAGVTVDDLKSVWDRGFTEMELVKRATLAGTGTCQGSACLPHIRSFLESQGRELQPPFTARPLTRQLTMEEVAAGAHHPATSRTPLHNEHLALGARLQRSGGWWRAWDYGDVDAERVAVRRGVSLGDVSTLGKFLVGGPDALALLELLYPTNVSTLKVGCSRYALLLNERGYVLDDGLICRDAEECFYLTLTSAGSTFGELWLRDWAESRGFDVVILNQTHALGAINVTGPRAAELLIRAGVTQSASAGEAESADCLPAFARHQQVVVAGVACRALRLSFTGELSYELHAAAADTHALWRALMACGAGMGVRPHGLDALLRLRLEKGHLVVGQDTDFDSTPRRLDHAWAVALSKPEFVGRGAILRTDRRPLDRQLVGLETECPAPCEGAPIWVGERYSGYVTSSTDSAALGKGVMLAWLDLVDGALPEMVEIGERGDTRSARRVPLPFYDPDSCRSKVAVEVSAEWVAKGSAVRPSLVQQGDQNSDTECAGEITQEGSSWGRFERIEATRIAATPERLGRLLESPALRSTVLVRVAPDEALALGQVVEVGPALAKIEMPGVIVERETGFAIARFETAHADQLLARGCAWDTVSEGERESDSGWAQGAAWGVPVKLRRGNQVTEMLVPAPLATTLERRMADTERSIGSATQLRVESQ